MAAEKFVVELNAEQRARLKASISKGNAPANQIVEALDTNLTMVSRVRETLVTKGFDAVHRAETELLDQFCSSSSSTDSGPEAVSATAPDGASVNPNGA